jgi:hypothetical protein
MSPEDVSTPHVFIMWRGRAIGYNCPSRDVEEFLAVGLEGKQPALSHAVRQRAVSGCPQWSTLVLTHPGAIR